LDVVDKQLFSSFVPTAAKLIDTYIDKDLSHIAWAYAVANVDAPTLFNDHFINKCVEKEERLEKENLSSSTNGICGKQKRSQILGYQKNFKVNVSIHLSTEIQRPQSSKMM